MFAVLYRWRIKPGLEDQFAEGWGLVTRAIRAQCGSYGARLHVADDGLHVAYARWPDALTRENCGWSEPRGQQLMADSIGQSFDEITMIVAVDLLDEPTESSPIRVTDRS